jgi:hypothetical protein
MSTGTTRLLPPKSSAKCLASMHCELRGCDAKTPQLCLPFSHDLLNSGTKLLLQFRVLGLGLLQDGDVGVGVFPKREEILISRTRFGCIAL